VWSESTPGPALAPGWATAAVEPAPAPSAHQKGSLTTGVEIADRHEKKSGNATIGPEPPALPGRAHGSVEVAAGENKTPSW